MCIHEESVTPLPLFFDCPVRKRKASGDLESNHLEAEDKMMPNANKDNEEQWPVEENVGDTENEEAWEEELNETLTLNVEIRDWGALQTQVKADLKKKHKSLPLSQINQLMILRIFANLCLKGYGQIEASFKITQQWHEKDSSNIHFA